MRSEFALAVILFAAALFFMTPGTGNAPGTGSAGTQILYGLVAPDSTVGSGVDGDVWYLDTANGSWWERVSGHWTPRYTDNEGTPIEGTVYAARVPCVVARCTGVGEDGSTIYGVYPDVVASDFTDAIRGTSSSGKSPHTLTFDALVTPNAFTPHDDGLYAIWIPDALGTPKRTWQAGRGLSLTHNVWNWDLASGIQGAWEDEGALEVNGVAGRAWSWDLGNPQDLNWQYYFILDFPDIEAARGETGERGATGDTGADSTVPGPQGDTGDQGEQGDTGADSTVPGPQGDTGDQGEQGDTGADSTVAGPPGATGQRGEQGEAGAAGSDGADSTVPGPQGDTGQRGPQGDTGADSTVPGPAGATGQRGEQGERGARGGYQVPVTATVYGAWKSTSTLTAADFTGANGVSATGDAPFTLDLPNLVADDTGNTSAYYAFAVPTSLGVPQYLGAPSDISQLGAFTAQTATVTLSSDSYTVYVTNQAQSLEFPQEEWRIDYDLRGEATTGTVYMATKATNDFVAADFTGTDGREGSGQPPYEMTFEDGLLQHIGFWFDSELGTPSEIWDSSNSQTMLPWSLFTEYDYECLTTTLTVDGVDGSVCRTTDDFHDWAYSTTYWLIYPDAVVSGQTGPRGFTGAAGADGMDSTVPGPAGAAGQDGNDGADSTVPGPAGAAGQDGNDGADSTVPGPAGADGQDGNDGADSTVPGPAGADGQDGNDGADSTVPGPAGAAGQDGNDGADSTVPGPAGADGNDGADSTVPGPAGADGNDGADSTVPGPAGAAGQDGNDGADSTVPGPAGADGIDGVTGGGALQAVGTFSETIDVGNITRFIDMGFAWPTDRKWITYSLNGATIWFDGESVFGTTNGVAPSTAGTASTAATRRIVVENISGRMSFGRTAGNQMLIEFTNANVGAITVGVWVYVPGDATTLQGERGFTGAAGQDGADSTVPGPAGADGNDGADSTVPGPAGADGNDGADSTVPGPAGADGNDGADSTVPGPAGADGNDGADSTVPGPAGADGNDGADSTVPGPAGADGNDGADSTVPGPAGADGQDGADSTVPGPAGADGNDGADSTVPGPAGADGQDGADSTVPGPAGADGNDGADSTVPGPAGAAGQDGADSTVPGPAGAAGQDGNDGADSTVPGPAGAAGQDGNDGADSTVPGPAGADGQDGADSTVPGPAGAAGQDGADSTVPGPAGAAGQDGADSTVPGPAGAAGQDGADSTVPGPAGADGIDGVTGGGALQAVGTFSETIDVNNSGRFIDMGFAWPTDRKWIAYSINGAMFWFDGESVYDPTNGIAPSVAGTASTAATRRRIVENVPGQTNFGRTAPNQMLIEFSSSGIGAITVGVWAYVPGDATTLQGPRGFTGSQGETGADSTVPGPAGADGSDGADSTVPGPAGADGSDGADSTVPGPAGADGSDGADSTVPGPQGIQGIQGEQGTPAQVFQGTYSSSEIYDAGEIVAYQGLDWISLVNANSSTPLASSHTWAGLQAGYVYRGTAPVASTTYQYGHIVFEPTTDNYYIVTLSGGIDATRASIPTHSNFDPLVHVLTSAESNDDESDVQGLVSGEMISGAIDTYNIEHGIAPGMDGDDGEDGHSPTFSSGTTLPSPPDAVTNDFHLFSDDVAQGGTFWIDTDGTSMLTSADAGDVGRFNGTTWVKQTNITGPQGEAGAAGSDGADSTVAGPAGAAGEDGHAPVFTSGDAFPASPTANDFHIFADAVASGLTWLDTDGSSLTGATAGDLARYSGTAWERQATLAGPQGEGVPDGGDTGQILGKASDADNDTEWIAAPFETVIWRMTPTQTFDESGNTEFFAETIAAPANSAYRFTLAATSPGSADINSIGGPQGMAGYLADPRSQTVVLAGAGTLSLSLIVFTANVEQIAIVERLA